MRQLIALSVAALLMSVFAFLPLCAHAVSVFGMDSLFFQDQEGVDLQSRQKQDPDAIREAFRKGSILLAGSMAEKALKEHDLPELRCILSIARSVQGRLEQARHQLERVVEDNVDPSLLLSARATLAYREDRRGRAIELSRRAIDQGSPHPYPYHLLAALHGELQNDDLAKRYFTRALEISPEFSPAHTNLGFLFLRARNTAGAERHFRRSADLQPEQWAAYYGLARVYEQQGRIQDAMEKLRQSLAHNESFVQAMDMLSTLYLRMDRPQEAVQIARTMKGYGAENADLLIARGLVKQGQPDKALEHLSDSDASAPETVLLQGLCLMLLERHEEAARMIGQAGGTGAIRGEIKIARHLLAFAANGRSASESPGAWQGANPGQRKMHAFIDACISMHNGRWAAAEDLLRQTEDLWPGWTFQGLDQEILKQGSAGSDPERTALAAYYTLNDFPGYALKLFEEESSGSKSFLDRYICSIALSRTGEPQKAVSSLRAALDEAPKFYSAHQALADLFSQQGKHSKAAKQYVKAYSIRPNPMLLYRAGKSYKKTDNVTKTEETYTRLINSHPSLYIGYAQLAWVYADEGIKLEKGLELAEKAKQLQPGNPIILDTIGWLHYKLERHEKALKILNKAVNIDDRIPSLLYHLGVVQYEAGMPDQSVESLKRSLEISERFDEADKARDFLDRHFQEVKEEGE